MVLVLSRWLGINRNQPTTGSNIEAKFLSVLFDNEDLLHHCTKLDNKVLHRNSSQGEGCHEEKMEAVVGKW